MTQKIMRLFLIVTAILFFLVFCTVYTYKEEWKKSTLGLSEWEKQEILSTQSLLRSLEVGDFIELDLASKDHPRIFVVKQNRFYTLTVSTKDGYTLQIGLDSIPSIMVKNWRELKSVTRRGEESWKEYVADFGIQ